MRHILVAVDDGEASKRVSEFVNEFFGGLEVAVTAVNIGTAPVAWGPYAAAPGLVYPWPYPAVVPTGPAATGAPGSDAVRDAGERTIASSGLHSSDHVIEVDGDVAEALRRVALDREVDLLVVGSTHKGLLERMFSPSVSTELAKAAPIPVLVVH